MSEKIKDIELKEIINKSMEETGKIAPKVKSYLESISDGELQRKQTAAQMKKIAQELVRRMESA